MTLATERPALVEVPLSLIDDPARPSRATMDETKLDELTASIRAHGFISTVVLAQIGDRYEVIAGHRRTMAARRAPLVAVPALVYRSTSAALEAIKFAENRYREDLKPDEEAIWFNELLEGECAGDTEKLSALLGEKRDYVEGRLALLYGDRAVFEALGGGDIGIGIAQQLNRCTDPKHRLYLLHQAVTCGATVGIVAGWIHEWRVLHQHVSPESAAGAPAAVASAPLVDDYFTCRCCGLKDNPGNMRPVQIHDYCQQARLMPALEFFERRRDYVEWPRTEREALALIEQLTERFPSLGQETASAS
jgi:ParB/RepB/Spo0J family partition protein